MYEKLMLDISDRMQNQKVSRVYIAEQIGKSPASVTQYLKCATVLPFNEFLIVTNTLFESDDPRRLEFIKRYCLCKEVQPGNVKVILEWLSNQGQIDTTKKFIKVQKSLGNTSSLLCVYENLVKRIEGGVSASEFFNELDNHKKSKNDPELNIMLDMSKYYSFIDMGAHKIIPMLENRTSDEISKVGIDYLQTSFFLRLEEVKANVCMKNGDVKKARSIIKRIEWEHNVEDFPMLFTSLFCQMAESYTVSDKEKSIQYIQKAINVLKNREISNQKKKMKELKATHDFIKLINVDFNDLFLETEAEKALYYALKGDREVCELILSQLEKENSGLTPFQLFTKAIANQSEELAKKAIRELERMNNHFYAELIQSKKEVLFEKTFRAAN